MPPLSWLMIYDWHRWKIQPWGIFSIDIILAERYTSFCIQVLQSQLCLGKYDWYRWIVQNGGLFFYIYHSCKYADRRRPGSSLTLSGQHCSLSSLLGNMIGTDEEYNWQPTREREHQAEDSNNFLNADTLNSCVYHNFTKLCTNKQHHWFRNVSHPYSIPDIQLKGLLNIIPVKKHSLKSLSFQYQLSYGMVLQWVWRG